MGNIVKSLSLSEEIWQKNNKMPQEKETIGACHFYGIVAKFENPMNRHNCSYSKEEQMFIKSSRNLFFFHIFKPPGSTKMIELHCVFIGAISSVSAGERGPRIVYYNTQLV